jgi:hypothetical protein
MGCSESEFEYVPNMDGVIFLDLGNLVECFRFDFGTGAVTRLDYPRETSRSTNEALGNFPNRLPAYLLDSGSRPGDDNAWCNFKCSGCYRPAQAARWTLFNRDPYRGMRTPKNTPADLDPANRRPYPPRCDQTGTLGDGDCWTGHPCD